MAKGATLMWILSFMMINFSHNLVMHILGWIACVFATITFLIALEGAIRNTVKDN